MMYNSLWLMLRLVWFSGFAITITFTSLTDIILSPVTIRYPLGFRNSVSVLSHAKNPYDWHCR